MINLEMIDIEKFKNSTILIELMITRQCSFYCEHCMYNCGPKESSEYMSDEVLAKVKKQVDFLKGLDVNVVINLVGGEPTMNFKKFSHILDEVMTWNTSFTMTTNGWWLASKKNIDKFFEIVSKYAPADGQSKYREGSPNGFTIRISDDPFHEKRRKVKQLDYALYKIFNDDELVKKYNIPMPDTKDPWLWRQVVFFDRDGFSSYYISPNGRGRNITNIKEWIAKYSKGGNFCLKDLNVFPNIHYEPDGHISDACGYGSIYDFGTVDDNIVYIMNIILTYKLERFRNSGMKKYTCSNCREMVQEWKEKYLRLYRNFFSPMNTMDLQDFKKLFNS